MDTTDQQHHDDRDEHLAGGDLLVGADAIRAFLVSLGWPEKVDPYYLKRSAAGWPIGNTSNGDGKIIASKRRLIRHIDKLTRGTAA